MSVDKSRRDFKPHFAYFCAHFNSLFRPHDMPFEVGQKTELTGMSAEVVAVDADGQPTKVLFDFAVSLDNPALVWFKWTWKNGLGSYSRFEIPAIGEESQTNGPFGEKHGLMLQADPQREAARNARSTSIHRRFLLGVLNCYLHCLAMSIEDGCERSPI
jgi:hypothetical protein